MIDRKDLGVFRYMRANGLPLHENTIGQLLLDYEALLATNATLEQHVSDLERSLENARTSENVWRKRLEAAAEALADVLPGEVGRLDLLSRIAALKAEREAAMRVAHAVDVARATEQETSARLRTERDALRANHPGIPESSPAGQALPDDIRRTLKDAMGAGVPWQNVDRVKDYLTTVVQERDAAIADNAALVDAARVPLLVAARATPAVHPTEVLRAVEDMGTVINRPHPGATLLARMKRLEEALEKIALENVDNPYKFARDVLECH